MPSVSRLCIPVLAVGLLMAGCASSEPERSGASDASASQGIESVIVAVRIADGTVTPVDARLEARVGRPIEIVVDSDTDDELHVHAEPDHTFAITPGTGQRFRFTVDVPGRVEIELHHAGHTVATLLVRE
ncbi:hypothetical protein [Nocardia jinanensis]|uniref:EfeO-type cupredoxin-like domain-containing protein n=1 Tax=Nocardia jinanensis TaxID=382504 RepID=A0A917RDY6_9NOCA|nr:hypothetical protein [Nocardia jinanensis]GGL01712.1 hypothetical protein GCM10011588_15530 [Nocardia jinanensis]